MSGEDVALPLWKPFFVGGRWPYWQCATPTGPYNFQANDEATAIAHCEKVRNGK